MWTRVSTRWAQFCQFERTSASAQIGRNEGGGQSSKHKRLDTASSSTCALELAKTRGCLGKDRFNFANSSTCTLELAEPRWGWLAKSGKTQFCQFEHATARIGRTEVRGWSDKSGETRFCQFKHSHARICRIEARSSQPRAGTLCFANSSTCVLEFAELRWEMGGWSAKSRNRSGGWSAKGRNAQFCQFEHLRA